MVLDGEEDEALRVLLEKRLINLLGPDARGDSGSVIFGVLLGRNSNGLLGDDVGAGGLQGGIGREVLLVGGG